MQKLTWKKNTVVEIINTNKTHMAKTTYGKICPGLKSYWKTKSSKQNLYLENLTVDNYTWSK